MTPPQFPRDAGEYGCPSMTIDGDTFPHIREIETDELQTLLDSYHELQALKVDHANLKSAMNTLSNLHSSRDVKCEALQSELAALKAQLAKGVRVTAEVGAYGYYTAYEPGFEERLTNATLILDKPEGGE